MAVIVLMAWFLVFKSSPPPPKPLSLATTNQQVRHDTKQKYNRKDEGPEVGWRTLYRDNWEFLCPVLGHHVVDPEEACRLVAAPARLGPIVVRDTSVRYDKPFTTKRDPSVTLVKFKDPVMSLPEYVGPRFGAERIGCGNNPGKWITTYRPVVDTKGRLIRYDPEQVRIFCRK
jgi:hypothetical protein